MIHWSSSRLYCLNLWLQHTVLRGWLHEADSARRRSGHGPATAHSGERRRRRRRLQTGTLRSDNMHAFFLCVCCGDVHSACDIFLWDQGFVFFFVDWSSIFLPRVSACLGLRVYDCTELSCGIYKVRKESLCVWNFLSKEWVMLASQAFLCQVWSQILTAVTPVTFVVFFWKKPGADGLHLTVEHLSLAQ